MKQIHHYILAVITLVCCCVWSSTSFAQQRFWKFQQSLYLPFKYDSLWQARPDLRIDTLLLESIYQDTSLLSRMRTTNLVTYKGLGLEGISISHWNIEKVGNALYLPFSVSYFPKEFHPAWSGTQRVGGILRSLDSGKSWRNVPLPRTPLPVGLFSLSSTSHITKISDSIILAPQTFFLINDNPVFKGDRLYRSTDAGNTWAIINTNDTLTTYDNLIFSSDKRLGFLTRTYATRFYTHTLDSGQTWETVIDTTPYTSGYDYDVKDLAVLDSTTIVAFQHFPYRENKQYGLQFRKSRDYGKTWERLGFPVPELDSQDSTNDYVCRNMVFYNATIGIALFNKTGSDDIENIIVRTSNSGLSWYIVDRYLVENTKSNSLWSRARFTSASDVYALSMNGLIKYSADSGKTWRLLIDDVPGEDDLLKFISGAFYPFSPNNILLFSTTNNGGWSSFTMTSDSVTTSVESRVENGVSTTFWLEGFEPHPASSEVSVKLYIDPTTPKEAIRFEIYNLMGTLITSVQGTSVGFEGHNWGDGWNRVRIPLHNQAFGVYILRCTLGAKSQSRTFLLSP